MSQPNLTAKGLLAQKNQPNMVAMQVAGSEVSSSGVTSGRMTSWHMIGSHVGAEHVRAGHVRALAVGYRSAARSDSKVRTSQLASRRPAGAVF